MNEWINDLMDEYPTNRTDAAIARLMRVFSDVLPGVMRVAVDDYLRTGRFFPKVSDLRPFVDVALEAARGPIRYDDITDQARLWTDDELLVFEVKQGTMPYTDISLPEYDCNQDGFVLIESVRPFGK